MAAKIKDGLFIGDADTSQDPEFLELNKISNLINFSGREVPNVWAAHGLVYNTYNWEDRDDYKLFDAKHEILTEIVLFVDKAIRHGASVLLFSTKGIGRCTAAVCAYLMYKYGWGFEKSYDFVYSKKPDIELNRGFVEQLFTLDKKLRNKRYQGREGNDLTSQEHKRIHEWDPSYLVQSAAAEEEQGLDGKIMNSTVRRSLAASHIIPDMTSVDELLMVHSYLNSKMTITSLPGPYQDALRQPKQFTLQINLANNQEAGVHLRRTLPPPATSLPPKGGILKGGPNNFRKNMKSTHQPHAGAQSSLLKKKQKESTSLGQTKQTMRDLEEDSSSLSEEEAPAGGALGGRGYQPTPHGHSNSGSGRQPQGGSIETLSLHVPSQSSQASDLYDFVGLSQSQHSQQQHAESKRSGGGGGGGGGGGNSAEERLHNILGDLQRGERGSRSGSGSSSGKNSKPTAAEAKSLRSSLDRDPLSAKQQHRHQQATSGTSSSLTPSSSGVSSTTIHDIASMNIQPSYQPTPTTTTTRTRTYGSTPAHSSVSSSSQQPIKASAGVSIQRGGTGTGTGATGGGGESKEKYQAWVDRGDDGTTTVTATTASSSYYNHTGRAKTTRGPGGTSTRTTSSSSSSNTRPKASNGGTPTQTYRHGSPAPQISRTGLASRARDPPPPPPNRDDGSIDERDNRSTQTSSSIGSRIRSSTPTRQSSDPPTVGRSNTPLRQRAPSPSVRDRSSSSSGIGISPREGGESTRRISSGGGRENGSRSSTPLRERPESRERGGGGGGGGGYCSGGVGGSSRSGTPSRGIRTDGTSGSGSGRSSSPWTERDSGGGGNRTWKY